MRRTSTSRDFDALSRAQIAAGRTDARAVDVSGLMPAPGPRRMADLLDAIQHVAEAATGERSFLHVRARSLDTAKPVTYIKR